MEEVAAKRPEGVSSSRKNISYCILLYVPELHKERGNMFKGHSLKIQRNKIFEI